MKKLHRYHPAWNTRNSVLLSTSEKAVENTAAAATFIAATGEDRRSAERPSITKSSKWVLAGTVFSKPVQLFTNILVARLLGPASFGVLGLASSLAVTLSLVASLGLGDAIYKYLGEYYRTDRARGTQLASVIVWTATLFTAVFLFLLWFTRGLWVARLFPPATSTRIIALCLCQTLGNLLFALLDGTFSGLQRFREFTTINVLQAVSVALFALFLAFYGAEGAITAYAAGTFASVLWGLWKVWQLEAEILKWPGLSAFRNLKTILNFSMPIWIGAFAFAPFVTFTLAFLARHPNGAYQLGVFNTANGLRMLVAVVPGAISIALAPAIMQEGGGHGEKSAYAGLIDKSFSALVFLILTLLIPCMFLGDLIFTLYGRAYQGAFLLFIPLTASAAISAIGGPLAIDVGKEQNLVGLCVWFSLSRVCWLYLQFWVPSSLARGLTWAVVISEISLNVLVLEFCILIDALPRKLRVIFYSSSAIALALMVSAIHAESRSVVACSAANGGCRHLLRAHSCGDDGLVNWPRTGSTETWRPANSRFHCYLTTHKQFGLVICVYRNPKPPQHIFAVARKGCA